MAREVADRRRLEIDREKARVEEFDKRLRARLAKENKKVAKEGEKGREKHARRERKKVDRPWTAKGDSSKARRPKAKASPAPPAGSALATAVAGVTPVKVEGKLTLDIEVPTPGGMMDVGMGGERMKARGRLVRHKR